MTNVFKYSSNQDGTYNITIENVSVPYRNLEDLQHELGTEVDISFIDPNDVSHKQRKLIFALLNDIEDYTGDPVEYRRHILTQQYMGYYNMTSFSLSDCSMTEGRLFIEFILAFIFKFGIPIRKETSSLMKEEKGFIYLCILNRKCIICGERAELAHYQAVGSGRNRKKISHIGNRILPLCPTHHRTQHNMGINSFNKYYHLENSWFLVDEHLNRLLKGLK